LKITLKVLVVAPLIIGIFFLNSSALALGVGVTPGNMEFKVSPGEVETQTLYVINQSEEHSRFNVYIEGEHTEWFKITPSEFITGPGEDRGVEIAVSPPVTASSGDLGVSICVVSMPAGSELRVGAGIRVQTHVEIEGSPVVSIQWWILSVVFVIACVIGIVVWRYRSASRRAVQQTDKVGE